MAKRLFAENSVGRSATATRSRVDTSVSGEDATLFPLTLLWERCGLRPPSARLIPLDDLEQPYRGLLAPDSPMTPRLEAFFGDRLRLRALSAFKDRGWYYRRCVLVQASSGRIGELGAIRVHIQHFSKQVRDQVFAGTLPLGPVLLANGIEFKSRPKFFLAVKPNAELMSMFSLPKPTNLYGRRAELFRDDVKVGDVIEILPPLNGHDPLPGGST